MHGFEPGLPSLSYLALTTTHALTAATFFSPDRLSYPPRRSRRDRLRTTRRRAPRDVAGDWPRRRPSASRATTRSSRSASIPPSSSRRRNAGLIALELEPGGRSTVRALARLLRDFPDWELHLLHTKPLGFRPPIPRDVRRRVHVRSVRRAEQRAAALGKRRSSFLPTTARNGSSSRRRLRERRSLRAGRRHRLARHGADRGRAGPRPSRRRGPRARGNPELRPARRASSTRSTRASAASRASARPPRTTPTR